MLGKSFSAAPRVIPFADRRHAGKKLAEKLMRYAHVPEVLVLALPRGGVPVAYEIATTLNAPLDVFVVRKLGVPNDEELAMGAIASGGVRVLNQEVISQFQLPESVIDDVATREQKELERRESLYRGDQPRPDVQGRTVILTDDGLATGTTMRAAATALRQLRPRRIIVAVPVGAAESCEEFRSEVDEVVCAATPEPFMAVGAWYLEFSQTSDDEVRDLLKRAASYQADRSPLAL